MISEELTKCPSRLDRLFACCMYLRCDELINTSALLIYIIPSEAILIVVEYRINSVHNIVFGVSQTSCQLVVGMFCTSF